ncbi:hypothetical protein Tco_0816855 [Tanacetum coccineum]
MVLGGSLSTHLLADPVKVIGKRAALQHRVICRGIHNSLQGIRNVSPNGVFRNEVYGGDSEGFGMNPSSDEFRLCNGDEWKFINGGGPL